MRALALFAALAALSSGGAAGAQDEPLGSFIVCPGNPRCPEASATPPRVGPTRGFSLGRPAAQPPRRARAGAVRTAVRPGSALDPILFDLDSAVLSPAMRQRLDGQARTLTEGQQAIRIEGHADPSGAVEYNIALAGRRAEAVRDYLESRGIARERMVLISWGSSQPVEPASDQDARQLSRRVELRRAEAEDQAANPGSSR
jgi:peptidoglycan-associated lipoprotein